MLTLDQVKAAMFDLNNDGYCVHCKEITHDMCEPDARNYACPICNRKTVFGLEECLMMGIVDEED